MKKIVIMPGGFHPFHAGHAALYQSAVKAFPDAEVYVAASNDTKTRPFPFSIKEKLAKLAGVAPGHFVQVKSPFQSQEITSHYNPNEDVLIFVRSEKDKNESPKPGGTKKDGSPSYYQPWTGKDLQPFSKHAYMAYLPTVEFGPGIKSATEIRNAWPNLNEKRKLAMVMSLYPATQKNPKLAANVVKMLDMGMGSQVDEDISRRGFLKGMGAAAVTGAAGGAMAAPFKHGKNVDPMTDKVQGGNSTVMSDDGSARLYIQWNEGIWFDLVKGRLGFSSVLGGFPVQTIRIKLGAGPVKEMLGTLNQKNFTSMMLGEPDSGKLLAQSVLKHAGEIKLEVELAGGNKKVFKFTIEPDATSKSVKEQGVAEGLDDPWGDQGNFAGDTPVNIGGDTVKKLQVGDIVTYFGQKARIEAMSKTGNTSRITIANKMGGTTQDVLTRDLKRTGISEENGGVGGGFGTNYPGTYEQENGPFTHKGGLKLTSLTTESVDYLDEK